MNIKICNVYFNTIFWVFEIIEFECTSKISYYYAILKINDCTVLKLSDYGLVSKLVLFSI